MGATIGIIFWIGLVLLFIITGISVIVKDVQNSILKDYKYCINFNRIAHKNTNYPIIQLKIRDTEQYFLLDTGANVNIIATDALSSFMSEKDTIKIVGESNVLGVSGEQLESQSVIEEKIIIDDEEFVEEFRIIKWEEARKHISDLSGLNIIGILGSDFFTKNKWLIDFSNLVIWKRINQHNKKYKLIKKIKKK